MKTIATKTLKQRGKSLWKREIEVFLKINTIRYVAKQIWSKINNNPSNVAVVMENDEEISKNFWSYNIAIATDCNEELNKNFWGYPKKDFKSGTSVLSCFNIVQFITTLPK